MEEQRRLRVSVSSLTPGLEVALLIYAEHEVGDPKSDESSRRRALERTGSEVAGAGRLLPACICPSEL